MEILRIVANLHHTYFRRAAICLSFFFSIAESELCGAGERMKRLVLSIITSVVAVAFAGPAMAASDGSVTTSSAYGSMVAQQNAGASAIEPNAPSASKLEAEEPYARPIFSQFGITNRFPDKPATGPLAPVGNWLLNHGIMVKVPLWWQMYTNPTEGSRPGQFANLMWLQPSIELDLDRILGIPDARLHFEEEIHFLKKGTGSNPHTSFTGAADSSLIGLEVRLSRVPNIMRRLSYEQLFFNKRLDLEVGRMNLKQFFFEGTCDSKSMTCQLDPTFSMGLPPPAFSNWAGRGQWSFTREDYFQIGMSELNPQAFKRKGWQWGTGKSSGDIVLAEVVHKSSFATTPYPTYLGFGGYSNRSNVTNPANAKLRGDTQQALVLQGSHTVWRADGGASNRGSVPHINLFFQAIKNFSAYSFADSQVDAGGSYYGLLPKPFVFVGAKVTRISLTQAEQQFLASQRHAAGGPNSFPNASWYLELNSQLNIGGAIIEPVLQYVIDPDTMNNPSVKEARSGFVFMVSTVFDFGKLFGLN